MARCTKEDALATRSALLDGAEQSHEADPYTRPDGRQEWVRWSLSPWRTDQGEIGGVVLYTEFVTPTVAARARAAWPGSAAPRR